jgi:ABC-2 type transport system permease protein
MRRYVGLLRLFVANSIQLELEYRINLLINAFNSLVAFGAGLAVIYAMFGQAGSIGGWSFHEALVLFGVFMMIQSYVEILLLPNFSELPEQIRTGAFDFVLLKPVSSQFLVSFRHLSIWQFPELLIGLGVALYGMAALGTIGPLSLAAFLLLLLAAMAIVYAICLMLATLAFWVVKVDNMSELFFAFFSAGRFPVSAFPSWVRLLLTFVVPIAFITTVPAAAAIGRLDFGMAALGLALAVGFVAASRWFFRYAVASYTSAGG